MADNAKTGSAIFREARLGRERFNKFNGELYGQIVSVSGSSEQAVVTGFPTTITIRHPFVSATSWIRALPEISTSVMAEYNKDFNGALHKGYISVDPTKLISESGSGNSLYNELLPGEIDVLSRGLNHHFLTSRPYDIRESGIVKSILDGDTSCIVNKAVTYIDYLHQNEAGSINDSRRFGVVRRPKASSVETAIIRAPESERGTSGLVSSVQSAIGTNKMGFAKEMTTILVSKERVLLDYREGHVVDDDGTSPVSSWTGNNLRLRKQLFNTSDSATKLEIDNLGNIDISVPSEATDGIRVNVFGGSVEANIDNKISITSSSNSLYKADGSSTLTVGGFLTNLGQDGKASHPLLFGDNFIQAFMQLLISLSTHTHPGISVPSPELATACINLATKCPDFVSVNVQTQ